MLSSASLTAKLKGKWNTQTVKKNLLENSINEFSKNSKMIFQPWTVSCIICAHSANLWVNLPVLLRTRHSKRNCLLFFQQKMVQHSVQSTVQRQKKRIIYKGKRCNWSKCPHHPPRAYPGFCSMKRWMGHQSIASYRHQTVRPYPFTVLVGERGTVRLKYHAQEHN